MAQAAGTDSVCQDDRDAITLAAGRYSHACTVSDHPVPIKALIAALVQMDSKLGLDPTTLFDLIDDADATLATRATLLFQLQLDIESGTLSLWEPWPPEDLACLLRKTRARLAVLLTMPKGVSRVAVRSENQDILIGSLATVFQRVSGRSETLYGDPSAHGRFSPFVHFLSATWSALPNGEDGFPPLSRLNEWAWRERTRSSRGLRRPADKKVPLSE